MSPTTERAFWDELEKIAQEGVGPTGMKGFLHGVGGEIGPAAGATLGAGLAKAYGANPLSGAALGYGVGSLPEMIISAIKKRKARV